MGIIPTTFDSIGQGSRMPSLEGIEFDGNQSFSANKAPYSSLQAVTDAITTLAKEYNVNPQTMIAIAKCESSLNQDARNKNIMPNGKLHSTDIGLFQINDFYHEQKARSMGLDIYTLDGNIRYAMVLYTNENTRPWGASSKCHKK